MICFGAVLEGLNVSNRAWMWSTVIARGEPGLIRMEHVVALECILRRIDVTCVQLAELGGNPR